MSNPHQIYIAGAYTATTRVGIMANVQRARVVAARVVAHGAFPVTPHFLDAGIEDAGTPQFWYDGTLALMRRCDAVMVVPESGESKGTTQEIYEAMRRGLPVFHTEAALARWLASAPDPTDPLVHAHGQGQEDAVATIAKMLRCPPTIGDIEAKIRKMQSAEPTHCCMLGDPARTTDPRCCPACKEALSSPQPQGRGSNTDRKCSKCKRLLTVSESHCACFPEGGGWLPLSTEALRSLGTICESAHPALMSRSLGEAADAIDYLRSLLARTSLSWMAP